MAKRTKKNGPIVYKSYRFIDKDPIIDALRTGWDNAKSTRKKLSEKSGVSTNTLRNWDVGATRRPMFATTAAVARAVGAQGIGFSSNGKPFLLYGITN